MFKWIIIATYLDDKNQLTYLTYGPYSKKQAENVLEKKDFNVKKLRLVSTTLAYLANDRELPLKLVKLP